MLKDSKTKAEILDLKDKFTDEDRERFKKATRIVETAGKNINKATLQLIATLGIIDHYKWHEIEGSKSIAEYADKHLQLAPATRSTYLQIARKFMHEKDNTYVLDDKYADYNISQLMEMSSVKDQEFLKEFKPDQTIAKMKEMKKAKRSELLNGKKTHQTTVKDKTNKFTTMYDKTFPTFEEFQADEEFKSVLEQAEKAIESQAIHIVIERTT